MKRKALAMWVAGAAMVAVAGVAQAAGRGVDQPAPIRTGTGAENVGAVNSVNAYAGRRVDQHYAQRQRTQGAAEFAVMDLQGEAAERSGAAYHGRRVDSLHMIR